MAPIAGPNPFEMFLMMLLGGGFGMPNGVPPTQEDALSARVAPAECLFYASWAGTGTPDANSSNHTEQMLAEPEVQKFLKQGRTKVLETMGQAASSDPEAQQVMADVGKLLELVQGKPGAMYLSELTFSGNGPPTIKGGGLLKVDDDADELQALLNKIQARAPQGKVSSVQIGSRTFSRVELDDDAPPVTWGMAGPYLRVGLGDGSLEALMQRAGGQPPAWLKDVRTKLAVPRVSSTMYVDVKQIVEIAVQQSGKPEVGRVLSVLGLDKVQSYAMVSGMNDTGCLSRSLLAVDGAGTGLLSWIDAKPLAAADLAVIDQDSPVAMAFRLDPPELLDLWLDLAEQIEPRAAEETRQGLSQFKQQVGIDIREDILESLGDTWRIFVQPGPGALIGGWTIAIDVENRAPLEQLQQNMVDMLTQQLQQAGPGAPSLKSESVNGNTVYTLADLPIPVAPSWCLTDDHLFITAKSQTMKPLLSAGGGASLAQRSELQALFAANSTTLAVVYIDTRTVAENLLQMLPDMLRALPPGVPSLESADLPPSEAIVPHLQPTIAAVRRTADGVELVSQQTLPGSNMGASAPVVVALALPAVQAAREAARRTQSMNNLKNISLALLNYHDTYRAFPAGYNADADGKALLSWRVQILPFIEGRKLWEQFHMDEPWDSPHNKQLIEQMPEVFRSPNSTGEPGMTNYLGIGGADGVFVRPKPGDKFGTSMARITDGTSNTIVTVEVPDESAVIWSKPGDYSPNKQDPTRGLLGMRPGGFLAGFADGSVRFIAETVDVGTLNALFTKSGGEAVQVP